MSSTTAKKPRGSYTPHACAQCRARKRKCDGVEPTCGFCFKRGDECVWGSQSVKKPASKQLVESLKNRIEALEKENQLLRADIAQCTCPTRRQIDSSDETLADAEDMSDDTPDTNSSDGIEELCAPTKRLVLECSELRLYGASSAFRLNPNPTQRTDVVKASEAVDGVYELHTEDDFEWDRHLPPTVLTRSEHDRLLDILFKYVLTWCVRLMPELFFRDMYRHLSSPVPIQTEHYSPMLHNALIALACSFSDDPIIRDIQTKRTFISKAKSFMDEECQQPNISTMEGLDILGSCHSTLGEQTLGYMYFGMSGRTSQALGLNADCSFWVTSGTISHDIMIQRKWAYWALFATDVCWSLYVGRDFSLPDPVDTTKAFIDDKINNEIWNWPGVKGTVGDQPNRMLSTFVDSCELIRIGKKIVHVVNSGIPHEDSYNAITEIDLELNAWKDGLSPEEDLTPASRATALPHKLVMHMAYWWLFSLLHRPFYYRRSKSDIDHIKICDRSAHNIISLLATYDELYGLRYVPTVVIQVAFSAGTVFLLSAVRALSGSRVAEKLLSDSLTSADACMSYLDKISKSYESSGNIKEILGNMMSCWVAPRLAVRFRKISDPTSGSQDSQGQSEPQQSSSEITADFLGSMESWDHQMLNSSESQEFFSHQQPMEEYACVSSGTSMLSGAMLPDQPFMAFACATTPEPLPDYSGLYSGDFSMDDALVANTGMSKQELDDLSKFWR